MSARSGQICSYSAVVGAGTMGLGIAYVLAAAGDRVGDAVFVVEPDAGRSRDVRAHLRRLAETAVERGRLDLAAAQAVIDRVHVLDCVAGLPESGAELVIEAVPERVELKHAVLRAVEDRAHPAILASNTSSLSIDGLADAVLRPERLLGLHFFNPVPAMPLVEIVRGSRTDEGVVDAAWDLTSWIGKDPIVVRDTPGFATSRLGVAIGLEGIRMFEEGVASAADIDKAMELGYRHPMGPLRLSDLVGLDVRLDIARHLESTLGPRFAPPRILVEKVAAGELGKKSGQGFYDWSGQ